MTTVIRSQNEIGIWADAKLNVVYIKEMDAIYDAESGENVPATVQIDAAHIDTVIAALQKAKAEILEEGGDRVGNG